VLGERNSSDGDEYDVEGDEAEQGRTQRQSLRATPSSEGDAPQDRQNLEHVS
jgi:hypothetical protein